MNIVLGIVYVIVAGYYVLKFAKVLERMSKKPLFPLDEEELLAIRKQPEKQLSPPTYKEQKWGLLVYALVLLFVLIVFLFAIIFKLDQWTLIAILLLPFSHSRDLLNMFAIYDDGILIGAEFFPWKRVKSFEFKRIDMNHKYYGYSKEVNDSGYESIVGRGLFPISIVVMTEEMKEKLTAILSEHINSEEDKL